MAQSLSSQNPRSFVVTVPWSERPALARHVNPFAGPDPARRRTARKWPVPVPPVPRPHPSWPSRSPTRTKSPGFLGDPLAHDPLAGAQLRPLGKDHAVQVLHAIPGTLHPLMRTRGACPRSPGFGWPGRCPATVRYRRRRWHRAVHRSRRAAARRHRCGRSDARRGDLDAAQSQRPARSQPVRVVSESDSVLCPQGLSHGLTRPGLLECHGRIIAKPGAADNAIPARVRGAAARRAPCLASAPEFREDARPGAVRRACAVGQRPPIIVAPWQPSRSKSCPSRTSFTGNARLGASLRGLFRREYREVQAVCLRGGLGDRAGGVRGVSWAQRSGQDDDVEPLSGVISPSGGTVRALGQMFRGNARTATAAGLPW